MDTRTNTGRALAPEQFRECPDGVDEVHPELEHWEQLARKTRREVLHIGALWEGRVAGAAELRIQLVRHSSLARKCKYLIHKQPEQALGVVRHAGEPTL